MIRKDNNTIITLDNSDETKDLIIELEYMYQKNKDTFVYRDMNNIIYETTANEHAMIQGEEI